MDTLLRRAVRHRVLANLTLLIILVAGIAASRMMVRELFPEISVGFITVRVIYPGADPEEVEEGITRRIEEAIDGLEGIKKVESFSNEGVSLTAIEVLENYDANKLREEIRSEVNAIPNLPVDAERPIIQEEVFRTEVVLLALHGNMEERTLKETAERVRTDLLRIPGISQVSVRGMRDYEINIEVSEERLREYGLTFQQVADTVRRASLNLAGGTVRTEGEEIRLRTVGRRYTGAEFSTIVALTTPGGASIPLDRIAVVRDDFTEDPIIASFNGEPSATIAVFKTVEEDAISIAASVRAYVDEMNAMLPPGVTLTPWSDTSVLIQDRINLLTRNGLIGLTLVFCILWLFLDLRLSFWVAMGIPISIAGAMAVLWGNGGTINMMSLFGLIMVLGIIVDDAIVVGEAIYVHRKNGDPPLDAAVNGVKEVGLPVFAAVCTTIVAFAPLGGVAGPMGKFIAILPVVVAAALLISLVECLFLLPAHLNNLPDIANPTPPRNGFLRVTNRLRRRVSEGLEWFIDFVYLPFARRAIVWRYATLCVAVSVVLVLMGLVNGGFVKYQVFPSVDGNDIIATIEMPEGTPIEVTRIAVDRTEAAFERVAARIEADLGKPLIVNAYTVAGESGVAFDRRRGPFRGMVRYELLPVQERGIHFEEINAAWEAEVGRIPGAVEQAFAGIETGPPGAPIDISLMGEDLEEILSAAELLKEHLARYDGIYQIRDSWREGKSEFRIRLKPESATLGLTTAMVAQQLNAAYFGAEPIRLQRGREDIRVKVRYTESERAQTASLDALRIRTPTGAELPLHSVAEVEFGRAYASIGRKNGQRSVSVQAEVNARRANAEEVLTALEQGPLHDLATTHPGVSWVFDGAKQNSRDAIGSLMVSFPLAMLGIFVIIATIFRSYIQPLVIMITVPFGIIGAVFGHILLGYDVTMLSVFGMVALSGVVVNDAIVLIERVNANLAQGMPLKDALPIGGARRFRAIFLTTISTVGGLTPLIMERDLQAQFLIPMALSVAAGVAFATLLTLVLIPCLLAILNDLRRGAYYVRYGHLPTPEQVEPRSPEYFASSPAFEKDPAASQPTA